MRMDYFTAILHCRQGQIFCGTPPLCYKRDPKLLTLRHNERFVRFLYGIYRFVRYTSVTRTLVDRSLSVTFSVRIAPYDFRVDVHRH